MSLSGFMKQINKANQLISEKIGGAKGTEIDGEFQVMEKVRIRKVFQILNSAILIFLNQLENRHNISTNR
jgi:hypothetical protein